MRSLASLLLLLSALTVNAEDGAQLIEACREGEIDRVKALLDGGLAVDTTDEDGQTGLMVAARRAHLDIVRMLLTRGANINALDNDRHSVLRAAAGAFYGFRPEKLRRAPPEIQAKFPAIVKKHVAVIEMLIKAGAKVDGPENGEPPLIAALEGGVLPIAEALLRGGASLEVEIDGRTFGAVALQEFAREGDERVIGFLLKHGAKPDREALWLAIEKNRGAIAMRFIRTGVDISGEFGEGYESAPLLIHAAELGNALLVDGLIQAGAEVDAPDRDGKTALEITVRRSKNLRSTTIVGAPSWARSSNLADYERSSRNFLATAEVLIAAGAKTGDAPAIAPDFIAFLRLFASHLANRDFQAVAALTGTEKGELDPAAIVGHEHFDTILVPVFARMRGMLDLTLRTRELWSRGVYPRGVPVVRTEGDLGGVSVGLSSIRFMRKGGQWTLIVPPLSFLDKAAAKRKPDARTLQREFRDLSNAGYYEAAIVHGRALLKCDDLKENDRFLMTWALGNAQVGAGHYDTAEASLARALELARERFRWLPLETLTALACLRGDMKQARARAAELQGAMRTAIEKFDSDDKHRRSMMWARFAQTYSNVGAALTMAGRHDEARAVLEEGREAIRRGEGAAAPTAIYVSMQLANLYGMTGQTESALSAYAALWKTIEAGTGPTTAVAAQVQTNLATLHQTRGDTATARKHMERAVRIGRGVYGATPDYGLLLVQQGGLLLQEGDISAATASFAGAREVLEGSGNGALSMAVLGSASCSLAAEEFEEAARMLDRAAQLTAESFGAGHRNMTNVHATRARLLQCTGDLEGARAELLKAVAIVERERGQLRNDFDRRRYLGMVEGLYGALGSICLEAKLDEQVFETVERHKAKSLLELLARKPFVPREGADAVAALEALDDKARRAASRDLTLLDDGGRSGGASVAFGDTARHEILQRLRKLNPELEALVSVTWPTVKDVQGALDADTRLVEFHTLGPQVIAIVIGSKSFRVVKLAVAPDDLDKAAAAFVRKVSDRNSPVADAQRLGHELYGHLLRPLDPVLKDAAKLVIVPFGKLHYVPFGALFDGEQWLTDRYRLSHAPSAGIYRMLKKRETPKTGGFLALANPASYLSRLPGAESEVEEIRQYYKQSTVHGGNEATEQTLKLRKTPPAVFHYAGHGVFDADAPELSHLALAPAEGEDGRLEAHEIHGLDFRGTRLVVLSACQGATGELGGGDEIVGLVRPFLATGAGAVVASLWNVDDNATARWMSQFYESLAKDGLNPTDAVRKAQARVRKSSLYRHPYFWAAFQLYGAP